jgi:tetratricopeptide (TPR) repeat protein
MVTNNTTRDLIQQGIDLRESGKYRESLEILKQAESDPTFQKDSYSEQARTYDMMGKLEQAKAYLTKALALDPQSAELLAFMGELFLLERNSIEAIKHLEKAVELQPDNIKASQSLLRLYYDSKDYDAEHDLFVKLLPQFIDDQEFLYTYCICMLERSPKQNEIFIRESLSHLKKIQEAGFQHEKLEFFFAKAHFLLGEYDACVTHIGNFLLARRQTASPVRRYGIFIMVNANDAPFFQNHINDLEKYGDKVLVKVLDDSPANKKDLIGAPIYMPGEPVSL